MGDNNVVCDLWQAFFLAYAKENCKDAENVACVQTKYPDCSFDDICNLQHGCGYFKDTSWEKVHGYTCEGKVGFGTQDPTAVFTMSCDVELTSQGTVAVLSIVAALSVCVVCLCWRVCAQRRRDPPLLAQPQ